MSIGGGASVNVGIGSGSSVQQGGIGIGGGAQFNRDVSQGVYDLPAGAVLPLQLNPGQKLRIVAETAGDWCSLNLRQGADVAFHFNVRFGDKTVVRNTKIGDSWGVEEKDGHFPFSRDSIYTIDFEIGHNNIEVNVNGQPLTVYGLRTPLYDIDNLELEGGFKVHSVQLL